MEQPFVVAEREVDLPRIIVWDAFVDPELVSGWLAEAVIVPEVGGEYNLTWLHRVGQPDTFGRIAALWTPELLVVDTTNLGRLEFTLHELPGGMRGTSTLIRVEVGMAGDPVLAERVAEQWRVHLEQLEQLLRGHPVVWPTRPE